MTFAEAYDKIISLTEDCDVSNLYYNMGIDQDYADDAQKLSVALIIINSGMIPVHSEALSVLKKAARNMIDYGHVEQESPEVRAETMDKMRHLI